MICDAETAASDGHATREGVLDWIAGINHWAMPGVPVREAAALAKRGGFAALELNLDDKDEVNLETDAAAARGLRAAVEGEGLRIGGLSTSLYWRHSPTDEDAATRRKAQDIAKQQLQLAAELGAGTILVVPGLVGRANSGPATAYERAYAYAEEFLAALKPEAEAAGVDLGIENVFNKFLLSPLETRRIVDDANSPRIGVYFDVGNILLVGYPEHWITILGDRIRRVHLKDFSRSAGGYGAFVDIGAGDVDWPAVGAALHAIGYSGPLTAEVTPNAEQRADLEGYITRVGQQVAGVMALMREGAGGA